MKSLNTLFEEDVEMQDAIEDIDSLIDDTDDIIIGAIEDRYKDEAAHLFTDDSIIEEAEELKETVAELFDEKFDIINLSEEDIDYLLRDNDFEEDNF